MFNLEEITMRDGDLELLLKLVKGNPSFTEFVLSLLILLIGSIVPLYYPLILLAGLFIFTSFDVIGYESVAHSKNRTDLIRYRIIQTGFQWLTLGYMGVITHWNLWVIVGYFYLHWMGVCDVLFYVLLNKVNDLLNYGNMPWLWWTPLGILNKWMGRWTSGKEIFYLSIVITFIWFLVWFLYPSVH